MHSDLRRAAQDGLINAAMLARLTRDLPRYLREPLSPGQAGAIVHWRLEHRAERFLAAVEAMLDRQPRSPYSLLMRAAGCEPGDLRSLVAAEGVEGALQRLAAAGVYLAYDEFKSRREIVRGSLRFTPQPDDFDNPATRAHLIRRTSGSRGVSSAVKVSLAHLQEAAVTMSLGQRALGLHEADHVIWLAGPFLWSLGYAKFGQPPVAWFYPLEPLTTEIKLAGEYVALLSRATRLPLPRPRFLGLREPERLARWLRDRARRGRPVCLTTYASSAVRVAVAARDQGLSLDGVWLNATGEPITAAKRQALAASGANVMYHYGFAEASFNHYGCGEPRAADDIHVSSDALAIIQQERTIGPGGPAVNAFLFTTLLPTAPKLMLNVENGDYGRLERRECGCLLGALGLRDHVAEIESHDKLTSEGMTFARSRILRVLEVVLPERFGGVSTDYQVLEEREDADGIRRLFLIVSPSVGAVDEARLKQIFLDELGRDGELDEFMAQIWKQAGAIEVRRETPHAMPGGKTLAFHVAARPSA